MKNTTPTTTPSSTPTLDPQIVHLAQSIRQVESGGNFEAKGASGEHGAYQFEPSTWDQAAPKFGVTTPLQNASPDEQNKVAYDQLESWKQQHPDWNVGNFASAWNAGEKNPNAYLNNNVGTNSLGVSYDTPAYAQKVAQTYQSLKGNQPIPDGVTNATGASQPHEGLSLFDKIALGLGGIGLGAGAIAFGQPEALPEAGALTGEALGTSTAGGAASAGGLLGKIGSGIKSAILPALGLEEVGSVAKGVLGGTSTSDTGLSGQEEASATQQASQAQIEEEETLADQQQTEKQINDAKSAQNALLQSLQTTPTGKVLAQSPQTNSTLEYMAHNGYLPNTESGYNNYSEANTKADNSISEMSQGVEKVLQEEGGKGHLSDAVKEAYDNIDKYVPTHERASAKKYVDELAQTYNETYGKGAGIIGLHQMEQGKREQYKAVSKWDATRPSAKTAAHRSFAKGLRSTIEKNTKHKDLYNRVMKEEQKIFDAKKIMKKMNGKKALEHKGIFRGILKSYGKYVGTYIGDKIGGPLGAIVGTMVGDHITKSVDKRFGKTFFESNEGRKLIEIASKKSPHIAKTLKKELRKYGIKAEEMANREQMVKEKALKSAEYIEKKKGVLEGKSVKSPYEPYKEQGVINFGKKATPKKKKLEKGLPIIR